MDSAHLIHYAIMQFLVLSETFYLNCSFSRIIWLLDAVIDAFETELGVLKNDCLSSGRGIYSILLVFLFVFFFKSVYNLT